MFVAVLAIVTLAFAVALAMTIKEVQDINLRINRLGDALTLHHDTQKMCELTAAMVLEERKRHKIKNRPPPSYLTVIKGPKQ